MLSMARDGSPLRKPSRALSCFVTAIESTFFARSEMARSCACAAGTFALFAARSSRAISSRMLAFCFSSSAIKLTTEERLYPPYSSVSSSPRCLRRAEISFMDERMSRIWVRYLSVACNLSTGESPFSFCLFDSAIKPPTARARGRTAGPSRKAQHLLVIILLYFGKKVNTLSGFFLQTHQLFVTPAALFKIFLRRHNLRA